MTNPRHQQLIEITDRVRTLGGIKIIGILEILIGGVTLLSLLISSAFGNNAKSPNVFMFVAITGTISTLLGLGMLKLNRAAYDLLIYFSSVIILTKFLLFADIIQLHGALTAWFPSPFKSWISIIYHAWVIYYLCLPEIKKQFPD